MIDKGTCVLAGISGGGDSMAMLSILKCLSKEMEFELHVVHIHHGIRGIEADRDKKMVEDICKKWLIPCNSYYFDVPFLAKKWKIGLEEAGRIVRKKAFQEEKKGLDNKTVRIALAHNQDDLAETMLHNLCRGSGIRGLSSMRPVSGEIIRPVLCLKRKEIDYYLKENEIEYVTDSTNLTDDYTRNKIRHKILPLLEQEINPQVCRHMAETAKVLAMAEDYFFQAAKRLLAKCKLEQDRIFFDSSFFEEEEILERYTVLEAFNYLAGKRKDFQAVHVESVIKLYKNQVGSKCCLPYGIVAIRDYDGVWLKKKTNDSKKVKNLEQWNLVPGDRLVCPSGIFETKIFLYQSQKIPEKKYTKWLDYDKIIYDLCVRTRRPGDYMVIDHNGSHKKLSRCMIDEKIPQDERDSILLLACGKEVLWMIGGRINEKYKITCNTKNVLEVKYQGGNWNE